MEATPAEATGLFKFLIDAFGPGGAVLAVMLGATLWWIKQITRDHKDERAALVAQIKDSEQKRREDGIAQWAKVDSVVDRLGTACAGISQTLHTLQITLAQKGIISP